MGRVTVHRGPDDEGQYLDRILTTPDSVVAVSNSPPVIQVLHAASGKPQFEITLRP